MDSLELLKYRGSKSVFETLASFRGRRFTIRELARASKTPFSSVWRLVGKWERAGIVEVGRVGASATVKLSDSMYSRHIAKILQLGVTPQRFTAEALKKILRKTNGVKKVFLFGSVALGEEKLESDIDLAVLTGIGFDADKLVFNVYSKYGTKVVPVVFNDEKEFSRFLKDKRKVKLV